MAVVKGRSNLIRSALANDAPIDPLEAQGRLRTAIGTVACASTDSSGSRYHLVNLPSACILETGTAFFVSNWGYADIRIGTVDDVDALAAVLKSAGSTVSPVAFNANIGQRLWERLGLARDPGGEIGIYAHAIAAATGAGSMQFRFAWLVN